MTLTIHLQLVPKNKKIGAISAHNCLQAGGEASIQNRDFNNSRLIGSDMPRYKYGKIMDRWLFGEKKILWCQFISREIRTDRPGIEFETLRHDSDA